MRIFSYVKPKNSNSEGVVGNEPCSSVVSETPPPKRTKCNSIAKVRKWDETYLRYRSFFWNSECSRCVPEMQEQDQSVESLNFLLFTFCNKCLFVEVFNDEMFGFPTSNLFFKFLVMRAPWQTRKYISGSMTTQTLKSTALEPHLISS